MSDQLARDPDSPVFLELGERLRADGQLTAASRVAVAGIERHPRNAEARDLHARVLADSGHLREAEQRWKEVLEIDARHAGAHKGLGFLSYRSGQLDDALDHLEIALSEDPTDASVIKGIRTVRQAMEALEEEAAGLSGPAFEGIEGVDQRVLLADRRGLVLGGGVSRDKRDASVEVAAHLAGVAEEADRTARMLGLGEWQWMVGEASNGNVHVTSPTAGSVLLLVRDPSMPSGRMAWVAERAVEAAREWLEKEAR